MPPAPSAPPRSSFIGHRLEQLGAQFVPLPSHPIIGGGPIAAAVPQSRPEQDIARQLGLADLSPLPRIGFKGAGAPKWLAKQKLLLPSAPNLAVQQKDGTLTAALSAHEHLFCAPLPRLPLPAKRLKTTCEKLAAAWSLTAAPQCVLLPRADSHFCFAVSGEHAAVMFAKLCGVDLRPCAFPAGAIAQTSLARVNAIIIRVPSREQSRKESPPLFYLLADSASADYLWDCLSDAMSEFRGAPIGLSPLL